MSERIDVAVVGGGVIGLSVARALALAGRSVHLLEAEPQLGMHTSSRNSEVIHAGIYYPPGSLKARLAVAGREALYAYCERAGVPHRRLGKLIVAVDEDEVSELARYLERARANGVTDLVPLTARDVRELEPAVRCVGALLSPSTGIVDSHALILALKRDAEAHGAVIVTRSRVLGGRVQSDGIELAVGESGFTVRARAVVNCAGLWAQTFARSLVGLPAATVPPAYYARGRYFSLRGASPFQRLVYPLPNAHGLGVHVTLDLQGSARFGPDVQFVAEPSYEFDESCAPEFARAIRRYYPALADDALAPAYVGVRPKLAPEGSAASDFVIQDERAHGVRGLVNLYGIESPGLTASLAIADQVAAALERVE